MTREEGLTLARLLREELRLARRAIDSRISPITLHPDDLENHLSTLAYEVKQSGIPV